MKIAIYHPWVYLKSGLERTILELCKRSKYEVDIYTNYYDRNGTYPDLADYQIRVVNPVSVERSYGTVLIAAKNIATTRLELNQYDALIICCDGLGSLLNIRKYDIPVFNLCFTPLRAVYDEEYRKRHLKKHHHIRLLALLLEIGYRLIDRWLWRRYHTDVCISKTVEKRVLQAGLSRPDKIRVCYPGIDEANIAQSEIREKFFFLPGRIMWTKNIELGIKAFQQFCQQASTDFKLIVAGMVDQKSRGYLQTLQELARGNNHVKFIVEPTDTEMLEYYSNCYAVIFTAFNEDLGLTPMEAMSKGKPVVAVNRGGPTEVVVHHETGYLVPADINSFALAMELLASQPDVAQKMGEAGLSRVEQFTWKSFVNQMDELIGQAVNP